MRKNTILAFKEGGHGHDHWIDVSTVIDHDGEALTYLANDTPSTDGSQKPMLLFQSFHDGPCEIRRLVRGTASVFDLFRSLCRGNIWLESPDSFVNQVPDKADSYCEQSRYDRIWSERSFLDAP